MRSAVLAVTLGLCLSTMAPEANAMRPSKRIAPDVGGATQGLDDIHALTRSALLGTSQEAESKSGWDDNFNFAGAAEEKPLTVASDHKYARGASLEDSRHPDEYYRRTKVPRGMGDPFKGFLRGYKDKDTYPAGWWNDPTNEFYYDTPVGLKGPEWFESTGGDLIKKMNEKSPGEIEKWRRVKDFTFSLKSAGPIPLVDTVLGLVDGKYFPPPSSSEVPQEYLDRVKEQGDDAPHFDKAKNWVHIEVECEPGRAPMTVKNDICINDFALKAKKSTPALFPNLRAGRELFKADVCTNDRCRERVRDHLVNREILASPEWGGPSGYDFHFEGANGRNAVQCLVVMKYKKSAGNGGHFAEKEAKEKGAYARAIAAFRAYPFDMIRERDAEGFVKIPIYAAKFQTERSQGWSFFNGTPFWVFCGKFAGYAKIKFTAGELLRNYPDFAIRSVKGRVSNAESESESKSDSESEAEKKDSEDNLADAEAEIGVSSSSSSSPLKPPLDRTKNGKCPLVFAHRGVVSAASGEVEHSPRMVQNALRAGLSGLEADAFLVRTDRTLAGGDPSSRKHAPSHDLENMQVLLTHDGHFGRVLGDSGFEFSKLQMRPGEKNVYTDDTMLSQLNNLEMTSNVNRFTHCPTAYTLGEALKRLQGTQLYFNIDAKPSDPTEEPFPGYSKALGLKIGALVRKYNVVDQVMVTGFHPTVLEYVNHPKLGEGHVLTGITRWDKNAVGFALKLYQMFVKTGKYQPDVELFHVGRTVTRGRRKAKKPVGFYTMYDVGKTGGPSYETSTLEAAVGKRYSWIETDDSRRLQWSLAKVCAQERKPIDWYDDEDDVELSPEAAELVRQSKL